MAKEKFSLADAMRGTIGDASVASMAVSAGEQRNGTPAGAAADAVSNSDTGREQIEYIDLDRIDADPQNFYSMDGLEDLASNIELCGLQQPLRLREKDGGRYLAVSGHRRRAALALLVKEGKKQFQSVPCIVERDDVSPALQELRLIYANSDTRKMSDADLAKQAERVTELLYQLKEEGVEFPGRMRDHVAEACKISATKLATLKVIREKLPEQYRKEFESGKMSTDAAYKIAKMPTALQERVCRAFKTAPEANKVDRLLNVHKERKGCLWEPALKCPDGAECSHGDAFLRHDANCYAYEHCGGKTCCMKCDHATRSWSPCGSACNKAKQLRAEKQKKQKSDAEEKAERDRLDMWKKIGKSARRLLLAVEAAGTSDKTKLPQSYKGQRLTVGDLREIAGGSWKDRDAPYWDLFNFDVTQSVRDTRELLGCSYDFLFGLTNDPTPAGGEMVSKSDTSPQWQTGTPPKEGQYWCKTEGGLSDGWWWYDGAWYVTARHSKLLDVAVVAWYPLPEEDA